MSQRIAVVVVNYASHELLTKNFTGGDWESDEIELFIVDNYTSEAELSALADLAEKHGWTVLVNPTNVGFGAAVDVGVDAAIERGHEILLIINPDLEIDGSTLHALGSQIAVQPTAMISPSIVTASGKLWFDGGALDVRSGRVKTASAADMGAPFAWLSGACLALSATLWKRTGGFDPRYFLYWEDVDFSQRVVQVGGTLLVRRDLQVTHDVGGTQGSGKSAVYLRYNARNRLLFAAKWLPKNDVRRWLWHTPVESYRVLVRGGRRTLFRWPMVKAVLIGSVQGFRAIRHTHPHVSNATTTVGEQR